jgi:hypothetical protein
MKESLSKDVFLGQGPGYYKYPGNKKYRSLVKLYAVDFHCGLKKAEKSKFIDSLCTTLRTIEGKFVKVKNSETNKFIFNLVNLILDLNFPPLRLN